MIRNGEKVPSIISRKIATTTLLKNTTTTMK